MAATRRLTTELKNLSSLSQQLFTDIIVDEQNILNWQGLIVTDQPPYNKGAFRIDITYPGK